MQLHQKYRDQGMDVITLNMEGEEALEMSQKLMKQLDIKATNLCLVESMSDEGIAATKLEEGVLPALNLYDRSGELRYQAEGVVDDDEVERALMELLSE